MSGLRQILRKRNNTVAIMGVMPWKILFVKNYFWAGGDVRHSHAGTDIIPRTRRFWLFLYFIRPGRGPTTPPPSAGSVKETTSPLRDS